MLVQGIVKISAAVMAAWECVVVKVVRECAIVKVVRECVTVRVVRVCVIVKVGRVCVTVVECSVRCELVRLQFLHSNWI